LSQSQWKIIILVAFIAGAFWIWLSKASPSNTTSGAIPAPQTGFLAPDFELIDADGKTYRLSALRGHPILINFWASWCTPCRQEMPAMERVYRQYQSQGFLILAVNSANQDSRTNALAFSDQLELSFPILFDDSGETYQKYQVHALPTSFFVNADGIIQDVIVGGPMAEALLEIRVAQLFKEIR